MKHAIAFRVFCPFAVKTITAIFKLEVFVQTRMLERAKHITTVGLFVH